MIPAIQSMLAVDCIDPTSMFNKNAGSDQLRYIRYVPAFLTSLEYQLFDLDLFCAIKPGLSQLRICKLCDSQLWTISDVLHNAKFPKF